MMKNSETPVLKLNYRRTALIGFAFFGYFCAQHL